MGNYAANTDIVARFPSITISATSKPSTAHITDFITDVEGQVDAVVTSLGYSAPVTVAGPKAWLKSLVLDGVSAIFMVNKMMSLSNEGSTADRFQKKYFEGLKQLSSNPEILRGATKTTSYAGAGSGPGNDPDNFGDDAEDIDPMFTHDMEN